MNTISSRRLAFALGCWLLFPLMLPAANADLDLWTLAQREKAVHRFSTLFTAQDVRGQLANAQGLDAAVAWCKRTGVTKVYIEEFRDGYQAERAALLHAKERFLKEGIEPSGCITPTRVGKSSTGWKDTISCYTDKPTQDKVRAIFEYAAGLVDEIMIDDFWFTDCACGSCEAARQAQTVTIGDKSWPVPGTNWADYRCELMVRLSQEYVLAASKKVNPRARLIIKYPQWYDRFHERGYEVVRQTADFDRTWVGTETRNYADPRWGGTVQYEAFFIMRWLGGLGGEKCGGGWFDPYGTTEKTYVEQARQTVLGGARESMLFCYGSLLRDTGPANVEALRGQVPELLQVAGEVRRRDLVGMAAYKPPGSAPENEQRVFDFVGMLGLPLSPCHAFPTNAPAAFFSIHALKEPALAERLGEFIRAGKPVLVTDGLAQRLSGRVQLDVSNVRVLAVKGDPKSLLKMEPAALEALRAPLLRSLKTTFSAPNQVALYLFADGSWVVENFNDTPAQVRLNDQPMTVEPRGWKYQWR
jgi:hypothetical protein